MAHFAKLGIGNIVERVNVVSNLVATSEQAGIEFLKNLHGQDTNWKQTSYNTCGGVHQLGGTPLRKNFAGIGFKYDRIRDAFIAPKPYPSWVLNEETCRWEAPVLYPNDGKFYVWDETTLSWKLISE